MDEIRKNLMKQFDESAFYNDKSKKQGKGQDAKNAKEIDKQGEQKGIRKEILGRQKGREKAYCKEESQ